MQIGPEVFREVVIGVAPLSIVNADMLLGMDFAMSRRIWLSFRSRQMFVGLGQQAGAAPASRQ
jgi:hypothetical protein